MIVFFVYSNITNMSNRIILTIVVSFCFVFSYAQCDDLLQSARSYKDNGEYGKAVKYYHQLENQCPKYFTEKVKGELKMCEEKLKSQNKPATQKPSGGNVPQMQYETDCIAYFGTYYGSTPVMEFDEEGDCENPNVRVTCPCDDWIVTVNDDGREWLSVEEYQNSFVVRCSSNQSRIERDGSINIIVNTKSGSSKIDIIKVKQEAKGTAPKRPSRPVYTDLTDYIEQPEEDLSITVKVTFEQSKADPTFENVGKLIMRLEEDKNLGLLIEIPWCNNQKSEIGFKKYPEALIKRRIKNITDHFGKSGIAKERISCSINYESNTDCDCAYVKITDKSGKSSK